MTYVIVTGNRIVSGKPHSSYDAAFKDAVGRFGADTMRWLTLNLRIEENR